MTFLLLEDSGGNFLRDGESGLSVNIFADDPAIWMMSNGRLTNCSTGLSLSVLQNDEIKITIEGPDDWSGVFEVHAGPVRLPSEHLAELRNNGFTVVQNIVPPDALSRIREASLNQLAVMEPRPAAFDDRINIANTTAWSVDSCRAVTHPVALWLMQNYLETPDIHFCHQPVMTVMRPTDKLLGQFPDSGWHSDYPYHPDVYPEERWQDEEVYGVQYNICIDPFREDNGATQFVPGSHRRKMFPPKEMNEGGTRVGIPPHDEVQQMTAPAGAALIYDSRTWHRACVELNTSSEDRMAILNAVCPSWVRRMAAMESGMQAYLKSGLADQLNERERQLIEKLCHHALADAGDGAPLIAAKELTYGL